MRIKTVTCHDVYNAGASLQAYALQEWLMQQGHSVSVIDYKPDYLSHHYELSYVPNPKYRRPVLKQAYILAKLPGRLKALLGMRKKRFDWFRKQYLALTPEKYHSLHELKMRCPEADVYVAGSDQIWNPLLPNGHDPAFFLDFVPPGKLKMSYAASFSTDEISDDVKKRMHVFLRTFDAISVRESSGVEILRSMEIVGIQVCDPVFLLDRKHWQSMLLPLPKSKPYLFVYDFDNNVNLWAFAKAFAMKNKLQIFSAFPHPDAAFISDDMGPLEFLSLLHGATCVLSNSFHATAFSLIFHKPFFVMDRKAKLNARIHDLLDMLNLQSHIISEDSGMSCKDIDWAMVDCKMSLMQQRSADFLQQVLGKK